jgi:hypothetical protein
MVVVHADEEPVDYPDAWFEWLQTDNVPSLGRQQGSLFLTRKGYQAVKEELRCAWETEAPGFEFGRFDNECAKHFDRRDKALERRIAKLQSELAEAMARRQMVVP